MDVPKHVSESTKRRNPELYPVGAVPVRKRKPDQSRVVDREVPAQQARGAGVALCVTIIRCGSRTLDSDNLQGGLKHLRDCIAESLGIDDGDSRIKFQYGQCETSGEPGCIVKIERVPLAE